MLFHAASFLALATRFCAAAQPFPCPYNPLLKLNGAKSDHPKWLPNEIVNCSCPPGMSVTAVLPTGGPGGGPERVDVPAKVCRIPLDALGLEPMIIYGGDLQAIGPTGSGIAYGNYQISSERSERALAKRAVMVDVGANMGMTSIAFALAYPEITVHSYELNPGTFAFLQRNIAANNLVGRVIPHNVGLGAGTVRLSRCAITTRFGNQMLGSKRFQQGMHDGCKGRCSAGFRQIADHLRNCTRQDSREYDLPTTSLGSALAAAGGSTGVLKVDCEGCEWDILNEIVSAKRKKRAFRAVGDCHAVSGVTGKRMDLCKGTLERSHAGGGKLALARQKLVMQSRLLYASNNEPSLGMNRS